MSSFLKIRKATLLALTLILSFSMGVVSSAEKNPINKDSFEVDKWASKKQKLVEQAICMKLAIDVESPKNPEHYSSYQLSYDVLADESKKSLTAIMISTTSIPYKEKDSLQDVPTPSIESLGCTKTVEIWRAMYEYKTISYAEATAKSSSEVVLEWLITFMLGGLGIAFLLKLARADKIAYYIFNTSIFSAIYFLILSFFISISVALIYSILEYFNIASSYRWQIAVIVLASLIACSLIVPYQTKNGYVSTLWKELENYVYVIRDRKKSKNLETKPSQIKQIQQLDKALDKEIENRFFYQLFFVIFCFFIYWWLKDFTQMGFIYDFLNYQMNTFAKYSTLLITLVIATYCYTKYYDIFERKYFTKLMGIVRELENGKEFLYLKDPYPLQLSVLTQTPRALTEPTKYGKFDYLDDESIYAYWISSNIGRREYMITKHLVKFGIKHYLDLQNKSNKSS
jgi:hypothetical protein